MKKHTRQSTQHFSDKSQLRRDRSSLTGLVPLPSIPSDPVPNENAVITSSPVPNENASTTGSPVPNEDPSLDDEEFETELGEILSKLVPLQDLNNADDQNLVVSLCELLVKITEKRNVEGFANLLVTSGFCDSCKRLFEMHLVTAFKTDDIDMKNSMISLLHILSTCSHLSKDLCEKITEIFLINTFMEVLADEDLFNEKMIQENEQINSLAYKILITLFNTVHKNDVDECRNLLCEMNCVDILQRYKSSKYKIISYAALVIQAYLVFENEKENECLKSDIETFEYVLEILNSALTSDSTDGSSFTPEEVLSAIAILADADANKKMLVQAGVLTYYFDILKEEYKVSDHAVEWVTVGMSMLSSVCSEEIRKFEGCMEVLNKTKNHRSNNVKENVDCIIWELNHRQDQKEKHIFISYQRDSMEIITKITEHIQYNGYKTWFDEENMSRNCMESMARGVENAYVILICSSEKYKESPNCRAEAEYAFRLHKQVIPLKLQKKYTPDGWLGLMLGSNKVLDFSDSCIFASSIESLLNSLKKVKEEQEKAGNVIINGLPSHELSSGVKKWSKEEVIDWLKNNQLQHLSKWFGDFNGNMLYEYAAMKSKAPDSFYNFFLQCKMPLQDALLVTSALDTL